MSATGILLTVSKSLENLTLLPINPLNSEISINTAGVLFGKMNPNNNQSLATVLENTPLVYKPETKSLELEKPPQSQTLHRTSDSISSSISIGSSAVDSGLSEDSSKRSSLDRKSQCSASITSDFYEFDAETDADSTAEVGKRRTLALPTLSLARGLFSRKSSQDSSGQSTLTTPWRLFGGRQSNPCPLPPKPDSALISTTGLILEDRPANLPAKSEEEIAKHRAQYNQMVEAAKKKDAKEAKARKRQEEQMRKQEEQLSLAKKIWTQEILPKWEEMRHSKKCRELWWQGLPPSIRGRVWQLAIGNDLNLTTDLYGICAARAKEKLASSGEREDNPVEKQTGMETDLNKRPQVSVTDYSENTVIDREESVSLVHLDVSRTFPNLGIFQEGGPYYDLLLSLLGANVCYRPDVGYMQGMSFVAAVLLLNLEPPAAFIALANLLNRPLQLAFFRIRQPEMTHYFVAFHQYFKQELPKLHAHFESIDVRPDLYLIEWLYTLYAKSLPLDVTCRIWDVYFRDGEDFLFKTALGILRTFESRLLESDFDQCVASLTHLPADFFNDSNVLFRNIEPLMRNRGANGTDRSFSQILADCQGSLGGKSPSLKDVEHLGHMRNSSESSSLGKSLSGLLGDWLSNDSGNHS